VKFLEEYFENYINDNISVKNIINYKSIMVIILSAFLSVVSFLPGINPFGFVMIAIASVFNLPILLVLISFCVGSIFINMPFSYILTLIIFFVVFSLFTAVINIEGMSKRYSVLLKLIISFIIVKIIALLFLSGFNIVDSLFELIYISIIYIVFLSGFYVLLNIRKGFIFSNEEKIALLVILSFCITLFSNFTLINLSLMNIMGIIIVLIYGYKNGSIMGACSGLIVGLVILSTKNTNATYVLTLATSGLMSGFLSRFGRVGIVIGFSLGSLIIAYLTNSNSYFNINVYEILISSLIILFIPKKLTLKVNEMFNYNNKLNNSYTNLLDYGYDVKNRLDTVSNIFSSLSEVDLNLTSEEKLETREVLFKYIKDFVHNNCITCISKYECVLDDRLKISTDYISSKLELNEKITIDMLNIKCEKSEKLIEDIYDIYNNIKIMRLVKKKEIENSKKLSSQYKEVSKIIHNISKNIKIKPSKLEKNIKSLRDELKLMGYMIYEDDLIVSKDYIEYIFVTDILTNIDFQKKEIVSTVSNMLEKNMNVKLLLNISKTERSKIKLVSVSKYDLEISVASGCKNLESISGDSYISMELPGYKYISAISDGAGSGESASKSSKSVINILEKLLKSGFEENNAIQVINSIIKMREEENNYASLDIAIFNLENLETEFVKIGAAPTYLIQNGKVGFVNACNIPVGLISDAEYLPISKRLNVDDIIVQITDGVLEEESEANNYFIKLLSTIDVTKSSKEISNEIYKQVLKKFNDKLKDDVTIVVSKIKRNEK
jgi:stage II sporulation protein E